MELQGTLNSGSDDNDDNVPDAARKAMTLFHTIENIQESMTAIEKVKIVFYDRKFIGLYEACVYVSAHLLVCAHCENILLLL